MLQDTHSIIRPIRAEDLPAVVEAYNAGIAERVATFETRPRTVADVAGWLTDGQPSDNHASRAAPRAAGFEEVGIQRRHGQLEGQGKDCVLVEKLLGPAAEPG